MLHSSHALIRSKGYSNICFEPSPNLIRCDALTGKVCVTDSLRWMFCNVLQQFLYKCWHCAGCFEWFTDFAWSVTMQQSFFRASEEFHVLRFRSPSGTGRSAKNIRRLYGGEEDSFVRTVLVDQRSVHSFVRECFHKQVQTMTERSTFATEKLSWYFFFVKTRMLLCLTTMNAVVFGDDECFSDTYHVPAEINYP